MLVNLTGTLYMTSMAVTIVPDLDVWWLNWSTAFRSPRTKAMLQVWESENLIFVVILLLYSGIKTLLA